MLNGICSKGKIMDNEESARDQCLAGTRVATYRTDSVRSVRKTFCGCHMEELCQMS